MKSFIKVVGVYVACGLFVSVVGAMVGSDESTDNNSGTEE